MPHRHPIDKCGVCNDTGYYRPKGKPKSATVPCPKCRTEPPRYPFPPETQAPIDASPEYAHW